MSMFYKNNQPLGTLSSGGHTILNKLKQALTQRTKLMFGGGLKATDNSQDGITLVDDSADEIEFSDWIAKTEEEKEEYAEEHAKFDIINAPGVDELVELKLLTKLWENPAPTSSFAAQHITLANDDYDFLLTVFIGNINWGNKQISDTICPKGNPFILDIGGNIEYYRSCLYVSDTEYNIQGGFAINSQADNVCVPFAIYGFKTNIKSIISAIASDVSTSASKCMLPDGETSVEDALSYSTDEHVIGTWIDGSTLYEKTVNFGALPNNTSAFVAHGISNLKKVTHLEMMAYVANSWQMAVPNKMTELYVNGDNIYIAVTGDGTSYTESYVTLRYTKTS